MWELDEILAHIIMTCKHDTSVSADKSVKYIKVMRATVAFLKVRGLTL